MPFLALIDGYLTGKREHRDIIEIACDWMLPYLRPRDRNPAGTLFLEL